MHIKKLARRVTLSELSKKREKEIIHFWQMTAVKGELMQLERYKKKLNGYKGRPAIFFYDAKYYANNKLCNILYKRLGRRSFSLLYKTAQCTLAREYDLANYFTLSSGTSPLICYNSATTSVNFCSSVMPQAFWPLLTLNGIKVWWIKDPLKTQHSLQAPSIIVKKCEMWTFAGWIFM